MTPEEYEDLAASTAGSPGGRNMAICGWTLGLCGESGEIADIDTETATTEEWTLEIGDVNWYLAMAANTLGIGYAAVCVMANGMRGDEVKKDRTSLLKATARLADTVKKDVFHGHDIEDTVYAELLAHIMLCLYALMASAKVDHETVMRRNIEKLARRYPEGFSRERSINRTA